MWRALVCAVVVGVTVPAGVPAAHAADPVPAIQWRPCPSAQSATKECGWVSVPRDYRRPVAGMLRIALARIPASGSQPIGSLVWDAGGPGGASTEMVDAMMERMSPQVRSRFDFVAFDPRGIGASRPALADCRSPWPTRSPLTASWKRSVSRSAKDLAAANRACLTANQRIARVMGTVNVVRDLDRIRAALGDRKLTFWGTSYGTRIGYVYALRYPQRVRAMLLDGSIDPTTGYPGLPRVGGLSQEKALHFVRRQDPALYATVVQTADSLTRAPVALGDGTVFSRWDWLNVVGDLIAFPAGWSQISAVAGVVEQRSGEALDVLRRVKSRPNSNEGAGFSVVNCLDYSDWLTRAQQVRITRENARRGPVLGGSLTLSYAIGCAGLRGLQPDPVPLVTRPAQRQRLADVPVLLANATQDGSTPMVWARRMQKAFDAPMIRYRSTQHVIWGATDSACVNRPLDRFMLRVELPARSRTCAFVPTPPPTSG